MASTAGITATARIRVTSLYQGQVSTTATSWGSAIAATASVVGAATPQMTQRWPVLDAATQPTATATSPAMAATVLEEIPTEPSRRRRGSGTWG